MVSILTAVQLAEALQIDEESVRRMTRAGTIPHHKISAKTIRYNLDDVLSACRVNGHSEDHAVDQLAKAMHERLAEKRAEGKEGWEELSKDDLITRMIDAAHLFQVVDVANYAAMIYAQEKAR